MNVAVFAIESVNKSLQSIALLKLGWVRAMVSAWWWESILQTTFWEIMVDGLNSAPCHCIPSSFTGICGFSYHSICLVFVGVLYPGNIWGLIRMCTDL